MNQYTKDAAHETFNGFKRNAGRRPEGISTLALHEGATGIEAHSARLLGVLLRPHDGTTVPLERCCWQRLGEEVCLVLGAGRELEVNFPVVAELADLSLGHAIMFCLRMVGRIDGLLDHACVVDLAQRCSLLLESALEAARAGPVPPCTMNSAPRSPRDPSRS